MRVSIAFDVVRVGGVVLAAALAGVGLASTVVPGAGSEPKTDADGNHDYTYTVTPAPGESIRAFHVLGAKLKGTADDVPEGWAATRDSKGFHWTKTTPGALSGPLVFTIEVSGPQGKAWKDGLVNWATTGSATTDPDDARADAGPASGEASTHGPVAAMDHKGGTSAAVGTATVVSFDGTEPNRPYSIYLVNTDEGVPDPWDALPAFETWVAEHAVPAAWSLGLVNGTGVLNGDGDTTAVRVHVPDTPALVGQTFFVIAVAHCDGKSTSGTRVASEPVAYTIVE